MMSFVNEKWRREIIIFCSLVKLDLLHMMSFLNDKLRREIIKG